MGVIPHTMEVIHNTGEDECTISVVYKEVYHDGHDGKVTDTLEVHAHKDGHVAICTTSTPENGEESEDRIPLTLDFIPVLSEMLSKVTEELGEDIQKYIQEGEEIEKEYLETQNKWTLGDIESLFELAGFPQDFSITEYEDKIVCGGWNRVYLYPDGTIKASGSHCDLKFLDAVNQLGVELT